MAISCCDVDDDLSLQVLDDGWGVLPWLCRTFTNTTAITTGIHLREGGKEGGREGEREKM